MQTRLPVISPRPHHREELANKLEDIARDLRGLNTSSPILPTSPVEISHWFLSASPVLAISGIASGHPKLGTKPIATTQLYYIDTERGLARTLNTWYRLGVPMDTPSSSLEH